MLQEDRAALSNRLPGSVGVIVSPVLDARWNAVKFQNVSIICFIQAQKLSKSFRCARSEPPAASIAHAISIKNYSNDPFESNGLNIAAPVAQAVTYTSIV